MGTAAYMGPEQIDGREVNEKTDIYAFGCLLLEKKSEHRQKEMQDVMFQLKSVEENMKREIPQTLSIGAPGFEKKRKLVLVGSLLFVIVAASVLVIGRGAYWDMPRSSSPVSIQSLLVQGTKTELDLGENASLRARVHYTDGSEKEVAQGVQWISSSPLNAAIFANGQVQARGPGVTEIMARLGEWPRS